MKCKECRECNGYACRGQIPGLGGKGSGSTFIRNVEMLKKVKFNMDVIGEDKEISTDSFLLGKKVSIPVYAAPIAGILNNYGYEQSDIDYCQQLLSGCKAFGTIGFVGDGIDYENFFVKPAKVIDQLEGAGILTMKPWVEEGIQLRVDAIKGLNYFAMATDVDAAGLPLLRNSAIKTELKSEDKLRAFKKMVNKPLIVKGIMSKEAAIACVNAGVDAIVVSNHGGRVLDDCLSTIEVLAEIKEVVQDRMEILIDGGFRSGYNVFKALALGADGVLIGRPLTLSEIKNGQQGVIDYYQKIQAELIDAMRMCGVSSIKEISSKNVRVTF